MSEYVIFKQKYVIVRAARTPGYPGVVYYTASCPPWNGEIEKAIVYHDIKDAETICLFLGDSSFVGDWQYFAASNHNKRLKENIFRE